MHFVQGHPALTANEEFLHLGVKLVEQGKSYRRRSDFNLLHFSSESESNLIRQSHIHKQYRNFRPISQTFNSFFTRKKLARATFQKVDSAAARQLAAACHPFDPRVPKSREQRTGRLFQPIDLDFVFQRLEFRVAGDQFGFA
jgi:hypothetical protein